MSEHKVGYTDDMGEIVGELRPVPDFLPPPDQLARSLGSVVYTVDVTLTLDRDTVEFFEREAEKSGVPYLYLIRALVDRHARAARAVHEAA